MAENVLASSKKLKEIIHQRIAEHIAITEKTKPETNLSKARA
jgi:hypothetical protein